MVLSGLAVSSLGFTNPAPLSTTDVSRTMPIHAFRSADCTGEIVEISGIIHMISKTQADGSVIGHFNYQGVTARGMTSGIEYRVAAVDHFHLKTSVASSVNSVRNFFLISPGAEDNLLVTTVYHITMNANGEIMSEINSLDMKCAG